MGGRVDIEVHRIAFFAPGRTGCAAFGAIGHHDLDGGKCSQDGYWLSSSQILKVWGEKRGSLDYQNCGTFAQWRIARRYLQAAGLARLYIRRTAITRAQTQGMADRDTEIDMNHELTAEDGRKRRTLKPLKRDFAFLALPGSWLQALFSLVLAAVTTLAVPVALRRMIDHGFTGSNAIFVNRPSASLVLRLILALASGLRLFFVISLGEWS